MKGRKKIWRNKKKERGRERKKIWERKRNKNFFLTILLKIWKFPDSRQALGHLRFFVKKSFFENLWNSDFLKCFELINEKGQNYASRASLWTHLNSLMFIKVFESTKVSNSQNEYSHETFSYKDDLRGGEYLIYRLISSNKNVPFPGIFHCSSIFELAKTGIFEGAKHSNIRQF